MTASRRTLLLRDGGSIPSIILGHRRILDALREFTTETSRDGRIRTGDRATARGLVAFLRQEILPFARREERLMAAGSPEHEATTFEHAFLEAEIDAFARAVESVPTDGAGGIYTVKEIERRIHRVEAILELHAARHEERWLDTPGVAAVLAPASTPQHGLSSDVARTGGARALAQPEIAAMVARNWWAILCTAADGGPYAVPVAYGEDDGVFYVASKTGRKIDNLETNPMACLTVTEVESGSDWSCVVVTGRVEWVDRPLEALTALRALRRQCRRSLPTSVKDAARLLDAKVLRLVPVEVTGRRRDPLDVGVR